MESRLASGTGDARKIKAAAASLSEGLATASVLGDVDALAARLTAIIEHADAAAATDKAKREEHRAAQTARKEALAAEAEDLATNSSQWKAAGDRLREILDEWRTISGLDRKTDDALWKRYSAAREAFNRRRGIAFRRPRPRTGRSPAGQGDVVRTCRRAGRLHRLGPDRRGVPRPAGAVESRRAVQARTSTTRCGRGSRPPRTPSSRPATPSRPSATPSSAPTRRPRRRCWRRPRSSTPPTSTPRAPHCAPSATSGTGSARCPASAAPIWNVGYARSRRRCGTRRRTRVDPGGPGARRPIPGARRTIRAASREGGGGGPDEGCRGGTGKRRAVAAVGRGRGRGARQEGARFCPDRRCRGRCRCRRRGSPAVPWSAAWRRPCGAPPPRRAAARCAPTPPAPSCRSARSR